MTNVPTTGAAPMTGSYRYPPAWNDMTLRPYADEDYFTEEQARTMYAKDFGGFGVIPEPDPETGVPAWSIQLYEDLGGVDVTHYDSNGSISKIVGFIVEDGRLFREQVIVYRYPPSTERLGQSEATGHREWYTKPNGIATMTTVDLREHPGRETLAEYRDCPVDGLWVDRPAFGDWEALTNPEISAMPPTSEEDGEPNYVDTITELPASVEDAEEAVAHAAFEAASTIPNWEYAHLRTDIQGDLNLICYRGKKKLGYAILNEDLVKRVINLGLVASTVEEWKVIRMAIDDEGVYVFDYDD